MTGSYSFRTPTFSSYAAAAAAAYGFSITATAQFRVGCHINHNGLSDGMCSIVKWLNGALVVGAIGYDQDTGLIHIVVGHDYGHSVASVSASSIGLDVRDSWRHVGVDVKLAASSGWVNLYVDGVEALTFAGDTLGASGVTTIDQVLFTGTLETVAAWSNYCYIDNIIIDDTTGEALGATVPDRRFQLITPNGNGTTSEMTGSDGNSVNNYDLVDDVPHDSDTTYVKAVEAGLTDTYAMTTFTLPDEWVIAAVIGLAVVRKGAAEDDVQVAVTVQSGATEDVGSDQALGTSYALRWERWLTDPATGHTWNQDGLDAVEVGATSAGDYV
jgi:hypothetical protein